MKSAPLQFPLISEIEAAVLKLNCDVGMANPLNVNVPTPESEIVPVILVPATYDAETVPVYTAPV